jgi:hypothetical protein
MLCKKNYLMIKIAIAFCFMFTTLYASAQMDEQKMFYLKKSEKFRKMKNTGIGLTTVGGICFITGIVKLINAPTTTTSSGQTTVTGSDAAQGFLLYLAGFAMGATGIPLTIVGAINHKRYNKKLENFSLNLNLGPEHQGLVLTYKFK